MVTVAGRYWDLAVVVALTAFGWWAALLGLGPLRLACGFLYVLVLPGYALVSLLLPRQAHANGIERLCYTCALSLAVTIVVGVVLNFTPMGIEAVPYLSALGAFTALVAGAAALRRSGSRAPDLWTPVPTGAAALSQVWGRARQRWVASSAVGVFAVVVVGVALSVLTAPRLSDAYSEFYVLTPDGGADGYQTSTTLGDPVRFRLGAVSYESAATQFTVRMRMGSTDLGGFGPFTLNPAARWQQEVAVTPDRVGDHQRLELVLLKNGEQQPYRQLHLWIDVREALPTPVKP